MVVFSSFSGDGEDGVCFGDFDEALRSGRIRGIVIGVVSFGKVVE